MPSRRVRQVQADTAPPVEPIVGRDHELDALCALVESDARLVTLAGPAGVGKTRLAWALAQRVVAEGHFERVLFCSLEGVLTPEALRDALLRASGVPQTNTKRMRVDPARAIDDMGQALVVLDGLDDGVEAARATLPVWLSHALASRWLVTTRRVLGIAEETVFELGPLDIPPAGELRGDAVAMFLRCVRKVRSGYEPSPQEAPFLADLVRELDGLPLALQLAAPRMAVMGPQVLLHRLRTSRSMLRTRDAADDDHHRSLDAALEGSWQALSARERDVLTQLTVFSGGMTIDAVDAVVAAPKNGGPSVVELIQSLRERSLIGAQFAEDGTVRLSVLRCVCDYAERFGDALVRSEARDRHTSYYAAEVERGSRAVELGWIERERANLLSVIRKVTTAEPVTARAAEPALRVVVALGQAHRDPSSTLEYASLLETALDATRDSGADPLLFGRALALRGSVRRREGRVPGAMRDLLQALHVARTLGQTAFEGRVLLEVGQLLADRGELDDAASHLQQVLGHARDLGERDLEVAALLAFSDVESRQSHFDAARALLERTVALLERMDDATAEIGARGALARWHVDHASWGEARRQVGFARARGGDGSLPSCDLLEVLIEHDAGDVGRALAGYERVESAALREHDTRVASESLALCALACAQTGLFARAHALLRAAFDLGALGRDAMLWECVADAIDAVAAPGTVLPVRASERVVPDTSSGRAMRVLSRVAVEPSVWPGVRADVDAAAVSNAVVRLAARALDHALSENATSSKPIPRDALAVGAGARWFRMPQEQPVSLERRRPLALILDHLAAVRIDAPGTASSWDAVQEAGWPGERILPSAGAHRVRVAVSTLRKLGLRDALRTTPEGYLLDPTLRVVRTDQSEHAVSG